MTEPRFKASGDGHLSAEQRTAYDNDGFLVLEGFAGAEACRTMRARIDQLIDDFDPESIRTIFSTKVQSHAADDYFRTSGDKIRYFFEEDAFDDDGVLVAQKGRAINKIGHALHDLDPVFDTFSHGAHLDNLARDIGLRDPALVQSMVICKQPRIGGEVNLHQDATFLYTEPISVTGFWLALEDADTGNGCMYAVAGGHKSGLKQRFRYREDDLVMDQLAPPDLPGKEVPLEAPEGTLVVLHGLSPHRSDTNTSDRSRYAYAVHAIDRQAQWSPDNWLRRSPGMPLRGFL